MATRAVSVAIRPEAAASFRRASGKYELMSFAWVCTRSYPMCEIRRSGSLSLDTE